MVCFRKQDKSMKKLGVVLVFAMVASVSVAQNAYHDSLKTVYKNHALPDSARLGALYELARYSEDLDTAWHYISILKKEANQNKEALWLARVYMCEGFANERDEKSTQAIKAFKRAIPLYRESTLKHGSYTALAKIYGLFNKLEMADSSAYYYQVLEITYQLLPNDAYKEKYWLCRGVSVNVPAGENELALEWRLKALESLKQYGTDRELMNDYDYIAFLMNRLGLAECFEYRQEALRLAWKIKDINAIVDNNNRLSRNYQDIGNLTKALHYLQESVLIADSVGDAALRCQVYMELGSFYLWSADNYKMAAKYSLKAREIAFKDSLIQYLIPTNVLLASLHEEPGEYEESLQYQLENEKIARENLNQSWQLPTIYTDIVIYSLKLQDLATAEKYALKLEEQAAIWKNPDTYGYMHAARARIFNYQNNFTAAIDEFKQAIQLFEEINRTYNLTLLLVEIGHTYYNQGNYYQSIAHCEQAYQLALELNSLYNQKRSCDCLSKAYERNNQPKEALLYVRKSAQIQDSIQANSAAAALQSYAFETSRRADSLATVEKERQIQLAHQEEMRQEKQNRNLAYGGVGLALLLAGGFYSRWRYVNRSKKVIEQEKERSESLLLNILPEEVAKELKQKGRTEARDFDEATILFTDFESFTKTSEKLNPKELVEEINTCFEYFDGLVGIHGIEKIKTIGDAYMAVGGLPKPRPDSARRTVKAALEMQRFMINRYKERSEKGLPAFRMRVGIHTGPVVAGIVGVKKFQYDIWGDTVNTASRMESNGEVGKVNISHATYELLKDDPQFTFESRGKVEVKGKGEMEMWFVNLV